ncbi:MAG: sigma-70 family RNA polymerase sigma factor [Candidatus Krumholzibacteriota bacterium]|nr:sigma-70 family RNA polymerase sigma factor [Candidatus Krumholzibacteriota bacterium]
MKIISGDEESWHFFVGKYSLFIKNVISRYVSDEELVGELYISLLEKLKLKKLASFTAKSTFSTWLFIVTRNHCRDHFRTQQGIRHIQSAMENLNRLDSRFFTLFYLQSLPLHEIYYSLRLEFGKELSYLDLLNTMERIEKEIEDRKLGRLLHKLLTAEYQAELPALEEVISNPDICRLYRTVPPSPDSILDSKNLEQVLINLQEAVAKLPDRDRLILKLRYEHGESARRISDIIGLRNAKAVYRQIDKLLEFLKQDLLDSELNQESYRDLLVNLDVLYSWQEHWTDPERYN